MEKPLTEKKKNRSVAIVVSVLLGILTLLAIGFLSFNIWLYQKHFVVTVDGSSMNDTLMSGDILYATRSAKNVKRGDVVIIDATHHPTFQKGDGVERLLIKRVIALAGDKISCEEGKVYLNGEPLDEPYLNQDTEDFAEVEVGEGEFFFLGDNRKDSKDARESGCMKTGTIIGVVPEWAIGKKRTITGWEKFRKSVASFFTVDTVHRTGE